MSLVCLLSLCGFKCVYAEMFVCVGELAVCLCFSICLGERGGWLLVSAYGAGYAVGWVGHRWSSEIVHDVLEAYCTYIYTYAI